MGCVSLYVGLLGRILCSFACNTSIFVEWSGVFVLSSCCYSVEDSRYDEVFLCLLHHTGETNHPCIYYWVIFQEVYLLKFLWEG